jgi:hypothetical protein
MKPKPNPHTMNLQKQIEQAQNMAAADKAAGLRMLAAIYRAQLTTKGQNKVQAVINTLNK